MAHHLRRLTVLATATGLAAVALAVPASPAAAATGAFVSGWGAAPARTVATTAANFTCRQVARMTLMGSAVRIRLSNSRGTAPVTFGAVTAAAHRGDGATGTAVPVRFGGQAAVTLAPGAEVTSDTVALRVAAGMEVAVSVYVPGAVTTISEHEMAAPGYCSAFDGSGGDRTRDTAVVSLPQRQNAVWWLNGVDVQASSAENAVVTLGDSLTDGNDALAAAYQRYPDHLSRRLQRTAAGSRLSVVNMGISGNTVVAAGASSPTALARFDTDVLQQRRVAHMVLLEGINDISRNATAQQVIDGLTQLVDRAHAANVSVMLATVTPRHKGCGQPDDAWDTKIAVINDWIRATGMVEATVDFHAAVRNPASPNCILPAFDSGDHLHFNAAGAQALANAVDLSAFHRRGSVAAPAGTCLEVPGGTATSGVRVQLAECTDNAPQAWTEVADGTVRAYGRCLDVYGSGTASGTAVILWDCNGAGGQQWRQQPDGTLRNPRSNMCLDTVGAAVSTGSRLQISACTAAASQRFRLPGTPGPALSGVLAGPANTCVAPVGTVIQVAPCTGQQWSLNADGTMRANGGCLDVTAGSTAQGAALVLWTCTGGANQQWVQRIDGTLMNPASQRCVDAPANATAPGTRLVIWDCHGGGNQRFRIA
ncbi:ricin-type beta-trefoil lectin domain protein [Actinoplanes sp. DH11]|uniref:ricin-type beta-trefoil lectin domain protein n=1 Tax=Actinoplanes sp. DH11 TaxID=2857011 RepID=UPI001E47B936|nr:ricin-type beta-trefoil lectin domain protein [Actinoplanes sp. DH11]